MCERVFDGVNMTTMGLPAVKYTEVDQGGSNLAASNVFFANGNEDPWQWAAIETGNDDLNQ